MNKQSLLSIENLKLNYGNKLVVKGVSLSIHRGQFLGIAGESGSGKSTLLKGIIDPVTYGISISGGGITYRGVNISEWSREKRQTLKGSEIGMILQNPYTSFNPIRPYKKQFVECFKSHGKWQGDKTINDIYEFLKQLGLTDGPRILSSCPYEMSGGMNQRIAIALSMMLKPSLLLADEPTSALDVSSQTQVLEELWRLRQMSEFSMILVSHNLSVVAEICDIVAIMYKGEIVETGHVKEVLLSPKHTYTKKMLEAIPKRDRSKCDGLF